VSLTDIQIKKAKSGPKIIKLSDGGGLQLWITPDGAKRWRLAYRCAGKQKAIAIGVFPKVTLKQARNATIAAKAIIAAGRDPCLEKAAFIAAKAKSDTITFDVVAAELVAKKLREGRAHRTIAKLQWLIRLASPSLGSRPIAEIRAAEVLATLRTVETRGRYVTAQRLRSTIGEIFRYAIATARAEIDPSGALKGALTNTASIPRAAITEPLAFGGLLRAISGYGGAPETKAALELLALTFARPGELRSMEWAEVNLAKALWTVPPQKMKMRVEHQVPLAPRAIEILKEMKKISGNSKFIFPSFGKNDRCMSENTINGALRRMGFKQSEMCGHGFRSAASTLLNQSNQFHPDAIERQLAHVEKNVVKRIYDRAEHWDERVKLMDYWADLCAAMKRGDDLFSIATMGA